MIHQRLKEKQRNNKDKHHAVLSHNPSGGRFISGTELERLSDPVRSHPLPVDDVSKISFAPTRKRNTSVEHVKREDAVNRAPGRAYFEGNKRNRRAVGLMETTMRCYMYLKRIAVRPCVLARRDVEHAPPLNIYWRKHAAGWGLGVVEWRFPLQVYLPDEVRVVDSGSQFPPPSAVMDANRGNSNRAASASAVIRRQTDVFHPVTGGNERKNVCD